MRRTERRRATRGRTLSRRHQIKLFRNLRQVLGRRRSPPRSSLPLIALACVVAAGAGALALNRSFTPPAKTTPPPPAFNHTHLMKSMMSHARSSKNSVPGSIISGMAHRLKAGSAAPDFTLPAIQARGAVSLSSLLGQPVVLVFGSFSCKVFCDRISELERLHRLYKDRAAFLFVSVTEARHRISGLEFVTDPPDPDTLEERRARVDKAMRLMGLTLKGVLDVGEAAETAFDAYPSRVVIVGADGKVALDIGRGVFLEPSSLDEVEVWLKAEAGRTARR